MVDWTKPICFENGERCELIETNPDGWNQWGPRPDGTFPTRSIRRLGVEEGSYSGYWFVHEDGKTEWPAEYGFNIVNAD